MILHYISVLTIAVCESVCVKERKVGAPCLVCDSRHDGARLDC